MGGYGWDCGVWITGLLLGLSCVVATEGPRIIARALRGGHIDMDGMEWNWIYWFDVSIIELNNNEDTLQINNRSFDRTFLLYQIVFPLLFLCVAS